MHVCSHRWVRTFPCVRTGLVDSSNKTLLTPCHQGAIECEKKEQAMWFGKLASAFRRLSKVEKAPSNKPIKSTHPMAARQIIWDAAQGKEALTSRRGLVASIGVALLALPSVAAAQAAERHFLNRVSSFKLAAKSCPAGQRHSDSTGNHVDLPGPPHADGTPHSDICIPR